MNCYLNGIKCVFSRGLKALALGMSISILLISCVTTETSLYSVETSDKQAVKTYVDLALTYMAEGQTENAKRPLRLATEIDDNSPLVFAATAYMMQLQGDLHRAEENYLRALKLAPDFQSARNNYGAFLYQQKRFQDAHDQFKQVAEDALYQKRYFAYENLGFCAIELKQSDLAITYFEKALLLNGSLYRSTLALAEIYYARKDHAKAQSQVKQYSELARLNQIPNTAKLFWLKLRIARATGDRAGQMQNVRALSAEFPDSSEYQSYLKSLGTTPLQRPNG